ncbi:MAG: DUF1902 domain-containing protein, partial [Lachnospiraceae bacterium]|nr:DUF1902 domain-containing protein [Lachnospiraceae bacterium]
MFFVVSNIKGVGMEYIINVSWDDESGRWMGFNDQLPVAFDADTMED